MKQFSNLILELFFFIIIHPFKIVHVFQLSYRYNFKSPFIYNIPIQMNSVTICYEVRIVFQQMACKQFWKKNLQLI